MTVASVATQQAAATSTTSNSTSSGSGSALGSLSGNLNTFLNLLMTQLRNQNPTSPLDTSQFTSQLVQYSSVEQQINTNTNLTNLIQLTQGNEVVQSANLLGKQAEVTSDHLSLQNGQATVKFASNVIGPVNIIVTDTSGHQLSTPKLQANAGSNTWTWNGKDANGHTLADGSYKVTVVQTDATGNTTTLPTTVVGTVTGVESSGSGVKVNLGSLAVDFAKLVTLKS